MVHELNELDVNVAPKPYSLTFRGEARKLVVRLNEEARVSGTQQMLGTTLNCHCIRNLSVALPQGVLVATRHMSQHLSAWSQESTE